MSCEMYRFLCNVHFSVFINAIKCWTVEKKNEQSHITSNLMKAVSEVLYVTEAASIRVPPDSEAASIRVPQILQKSKQIIKYIYCLLYTSDAADE